MLVITTDNPGRPFEPLDAVVTHGVAGLDLIKDMWARFTDITGGRAKGYEKAAKSLIGDMVRELKEDARKIGADAIIGLNVQIFPIDAKGTSMYSITAYGTAIRFN
jgi:uncharacterized protein YbjQ (UPF0145 family)